MFSVLDASYLGLLDGLLENTSPRLYLGDVFEEYSLTLLIF